MKEQVTHFRNSNFKHKIKILEIPQKLAYVKFYVHEISAVNLSKIYPLKKAKKTCKPKIGDLNRDWKSAKANTLYWFDNESLQGLKPHFDLQDTLFGENMSIKLLSVLPK